MLSSRLNVKPYFNQIEKQRRNCAGHRNDRLSMFGKNLIKHRLNFKGIMHSKTLITTLIDFCFYTEKLLEQNWPHYQRRKNEQMAEMLSKIQLFLQQLNIAYTPLDKKDFEEIINDLEQKLVIG